MLPGTALRNLAFGGQDRVFFGGQLRENGFVPSVGESRADEVARQLKL